MTTQQFYSKTMKTLVVGAFAIFLGSTAGLAADAFQGTWEVQDTKGQPFQITLSADGKAAGTREGEGLTGTWKEKQNSAVIRWDSGWTTKIEKDGDQFKKLAYEKGKDVKGEPSHSSEAKKVQ